MKSLLFLLAMVLSSFCFAQTDSPVISRQQIRDFLQAINLPKCKLIDKPSLPPRRKWLSKISIVTKFFDSADIDFMERQSRTVENALWDSTYVAAIEIANADSVLDAAKRKSARNEDIWTKKSGLKAFCRLSVPLYSRDFNYCIINVEYHCGGHCGEGSTNIYQRTGSGWVLKKKVRQWVS